MNSETNITIAGSAVIKVKVDGWSSGDIARLEQVVQDFILHRNDRVKPEKKSTPKKEVTSKRHIWTEDEKQEVFRRYQAGETAQQIGADFGVTLMSIRQLLYAHRVKKEVPKEPDKPVQPVKPVDEKQRKAALREYRETTPKPYYLK